MAMNEIFYIAKIDGRPWKKSLAAESFLPFALLLASIETMRYILNERSVPEFEKYFAITLCIVIAVYGGEIFGKLWRDVYTSRALQNLIYVGLIGSGLFNAACAIAPLKRSILYYLNSLESTPDWLIHTLVAATMCLIGTLYVSVRTLFYMCDESDRLLPKATSHHFKAFRKKEIRYLPIVLCAYFIAASLLIALFTWG
jgi:hypothetical protein